MMAKTHWKKLTNPDYLGAYSFNEGEEKILTISRVKQEIVIGPDGKKEECTVARFVENEKPMILNTTNCKTITKIHKTPFIEEWSGKRIQIYVAQVKAFGEVVDALRIRDKVPADTSKSFVCEECGNEIKPANGKTPEWLAKYTKQQYGRELCASCATKAKQAKEAQKSTVPEGVEEVG